MSSPQTRFLTVAFLLVVVGVQGHAEEVRIAKEGDGWAVRAPSYSATVGADGCLTSLRVGETEFLKSVPNAIPRGGYVFQDGLVPFKDVTQPEPNVVVAKSDRAEVRYQFSAQGLTWKISNRTDKGLSFVAVFQPDLTAVMGGKKSAFAKPPLERNWSPVTFFKDKANLRIDGAARIWGPWNGNHQIWQNQIAPKGEATCTVAVNAATEAQVAKAIAIAAAPPPEPPKDPVGPMWDLKLLSQVPKTTPAEGFKGDGVRAVFYEGRPYQGAPTKVFAWIGLPPNVPPGTRVPGMVLVHGGGGTAFDTWVRRWTSRGYAAIAMDTCGCVPKGTYGNWEGHEDGGPGGWGGWDQINDPREDQWTYHAVADALLAHSLLRSLPEVDPERTGLTGISWGGYLTSIIAGVDPRFKLAVPVYGCGFTNEHNFAGSVKALGPEGSARWMRWWDPSAYLKDAAMPMLWVTGSNDFAYTFNALQKSYHLPKGPRTLCIRLRMPHGHGDAGEGPKEIFTFADSILKGGEPLAKITSQTRDGRKVSATFESKRPIKKAELNVTRDKGNWKDRKWDALPATLDPAGKVSAELPEGVTVYYLNLFDDRDCAVSTEHEELP
jgi:hypothetical protein